MAEKLALAEPSDAIGRIRRMLLTAVAAVELIAAMPAGRN